MIGPKPFKIPSYEFTGFKSTGAYLNGEFIGNEEILGIGEAPKVVVPSTYADALSDGNVLSVEALRVPMSGDSSSPSMTFNDIQKIAIGIPIPESTDVNAFGGGVGKQVGSISVTYQPPAPTGVVMSDEFELGTKLFNPDVKPIVQPTVIGPTSNTDIIEVQQLTAPAAPEILDGGGF